MAESFCQSRLASQDLSEQQRLDMTLALIRAYAADALNTPAEQREPLWQAALDAGQEYRRSHSDVPERFLVQVQEALTLLARGELLRQEAEGAGTGGFDAALTQIRQGVSRLEAIDDELTREIPRRQDASEGLDDTDLFSLQNNVRFQTAKAYRNRALCYPIDSVNRIDALQLAQARLLETAKRLPADDPNLPPLRLEQAICHRLQSDLRAAATIISALRESKPSVEILLEARAEAVRIQLAAKQTEKALHLLTEGRSMAGHISPELDFAYLETYTHLWREVGKKLQAEQLPAAEKKQLETEVDKWRTQAKAMVGEIDRSHGSYWRRRADRLLVSAADNAPGSADFEILVRKADRLYLEGAFGEAVTSYLAASKNAQASGNTPQAFLMAYRAGLIEHRQQHHANAAQLLSAAALLAPKEAKAPDAHLLAALNLAQLAGQDSEAMPKYTRLLEEHLREWPSDPSAATANLWLARIREHESSWSEAIGLYLAAASLSASNDKISTKNGIEAGQGARRCAKAALAELRKTGDDYEKQAESLALVFENSVLDDAGKLPTIWTAEARQAALTAASIRLSHTSTGHDRASALLTSTLKDAEEMDAAWQNSANANLVAALAAQPSRGEEAKQRLGQLATASPNDLLSLLASLSATAATANSASRKRMAVLQLQAVSLLEGDRDSLTERQQISLDEVRAQALHASGDTAAATKAFAELAAAHPRNGEVQKNYATFLTDDTQSTPTKNQLEAGLLQWRRVAQGSKPQSTRWWRAKYETANTLMKLGKRTEAITLAKYLRDTPPGYAGQPIAAEFDALIK